MADGAGGPLDDEPTETIGDYVEVDWDDGDEVSLPKTNLSECEQVVCLMSHMANMGARVVSSGTAETSRFCEVERTLDNGRHVKSARGRGKTWLEAFQDAADLLAEQMTAEEEQRRNHA